jgi:hypothetical protein
MPGLLVSPHMAGDFVGSLDTLAALFVANFDRWRHGRPLHNVVDKHLGYVPSRATEPAAAGRPAGEAAADGPGQEGLPTWTRT